MRQKTVGVVGLCIVAGLMIRASLSLGPTSPTGEFAAIEDIKPGMTGYCDSPDEEGIDRLPVIVMGIQKFHGYETKVFVQIKSGRVLASGGVAHGMSGSPVYLDDGRLIGALARGPSSDSNNTVFVTPIGEMIAHRRYTAVGRYAGLKVSVPSFAAFCTVWGASSSCSYATLTYVSDGVAYATGHSFDPVGIQSNSHQRAVFSAPVMMTMSNDSPSRVQGMLGGLLGTMVWDGANGSVIQLGRAPDHFTVRLTMPDTLGYTFHGIRQNADTSDTLDRAVRNIITEQLDMRRDWDARITITFTDGSAPLIIQDEWVAGLAGLKQFLKEVLAQSPAVLGDIQITLTSSQEEYELQKLHVDMIPSGISVQSVLRAKKNHERSVVTETLLGTFTPKPGLAWYPGRELHEKTLSLMPAIKAVPLLNRLGDRRMVYLVCVECEPWTNAEPIQIRNTLRLDGLLISEVSVMPFAIGEQKKTAPGPPKAVQIIAGVIR